MESLGKYQEFRCEQWVPVLLPKVFEFFSDENNLEKLTPPWLNFRVLNKSTPSIQTGTLINYRLKLRGIPFQWQSVIEAWEPNRSFVDRQVKGPYALWHHTHLFTEKDQGTLLGDVVRYRVPGGGLGQLLGGAYVRGEIGRIFAYRQKIIHETFAS